MAAGDKKTSQLDLFTTLATGAQIAALNNGSLIRVSIDSVLNDTNNRFFLNAPNAVAYDAFGNSFARFHVFSGNTWISGNGAWLEASNARVNGSGYVFQLIGGATSNYVNNSTSSSIAGGAINKTYSIYSFIGNGLNNIVSSDYSLVGGGSYNTISGDSWSVVCGGSSNFCSGGGSFIGGGVSNASSPDSYVVVVGGYHNLADGAAATIVGGLNGYIQNSDYSFIGGGQLNTIVGGEHNVVVGGYNNSCSGTYSVIGGGINNSNGDGFYNVIAGGFGNLITGTAGAVCVIGGGINNHLYNAAYSCIVGGNNNESWGGTYNFIAGGQSNVNSGNFSSNLGGKSNFSNSDYNLTWGKQSRAVHVGATVLSDDRAINKYSQGAETFNLFYTGGAFLSGTPLYVLGAEAYVSGKFAIGMSNVPTSPTSAGRAGEITFNSTSGFMCTATNVWKAWPLYADFTPPLPAIAAVSNTYNKAFGSSTDYSFMADATFETVTFGAESPTINIPATAGTANYLIDCIVRYMGSAPGAWYFRLHDGGVVAQSTIGPFQSTSFPNYDERHVRAFYSTSAAKTIVLQASLDTATSQPLSAVASNTNISYIRLT